MRSEQEVLGLVDVHIAHTAHRLLGMPGGQGVPNNAQRSAMARRMIEVGPLLPRYVPGAEANATPAQAGNQPHGEDTMKKNRGFVKGDAQSGGVPAGEVAAPATPQAEPKDDGKSAVQKAKEAAKPGGDLDPKVVQKRFKENLKETEKANAEKKKQDAAAAKKKAEKEEAQRKAKKALKKKDVTPRPSQTKKDDKKEKAAAPKKAGGIGGLVCKLLVEGKDTDAVLKAVKKDFPKAKTSPASIAWYRSKLREEGKIK